MKRLNWRLALFSIGFPLLRSLSAVMVLATPFAFGQQIQCAKFDEQHGSNPPEFTMRGCRSSNELIEAGGIEVHTTKEIKDYSCFGTMRPEESQDFFIFVSLGGVMNFPNNKEQNGMASLQTFSEGVEINKGFAPMMWTQYPKDNPFLWSDGVWLGHGDAQMMKWDEATKSLVPDAEIQWKLMHRPRLHASVEGDTVTLQLELNNANGAVETLMFNRRTGRAALTLGNTDKALRCVSVQDQR
jgi:hypothetical protein